MRQWTWPLTFGRKMLDNCNMNCWVMAKNVLLRGPMNFDRYIPSGRCQILRHFHKACFWDMALKRMGRHEVTLILTSDHQDLIVHPWVQVDICAKFEDISSKLMEWVGQTNNPKHSHSYCYHGGIQNPQMEATTNHCRSTPRICGIDADGFGNHILDPVSTYFWPCGGICWMSCKYFQHGLFVWNTWT